MQKIDRVSADDHTALATDVGPAPMQVGAVVGLAGPEPSLEDLRERIGSALGAVPRLRQRLLQAPFGCGRPYWVDTEVEVDAHVNSVECPAPGDETALLGLAAGIVTSRLPMDRPLWRATLVTGLPGGTSALVVVFHHVLADGIGGLAILANLVDGTPAVGSSPVPRPGPSTGELLLDAVLRRGRALGHVPAASRRMADAFGALRAAGPGRAARCSLNRPTGPRRSLATVRVDLASIRAAGHAHGGTVNDVVLAVVAGALRTLLASRGEDVDRFVVSVPVSARRETTGGRLGNEVGAVPVAVPAKGTVFERIEDTAAATRAAKQAPRAVSSAVIGPVFRLLARLGLFHRFVDRQRLVHTFVTNVRGPDEILHLLGVRITGIVAAPVTTGNVTASFAVLSYAGELAITIVADPDTCPDRDVLRRALERRFHELASTEGTS